jgi:hypothetical protein
MLQITAGSNVRKACRFNLAVFNAGSNRLVLSTQSLKYKCTSTSTLNRVEALQRELTSIMATSSESAAALAPLGAINAATRQPEESAEIPEAGAEKAQNVGKKARRKR